jgi:hypothetical protein
VSLEKVFKAVSDWGLWEFGGAALIAVGRFLFSHSSEPPPSAASEPGMTLTPKRWQLDNRRLSSALGPSRSAMHRKSDDTIHASRSTRS